MPIKCVVFALAMILLSTPALAGDANQEMYTEIDIPAW